MSSVSPVSVSSGFAKLLATEDITVKVNSEAPTASFDVESRTLTMPVWENMSEELTDMLVGHEVSHALHTTDPDLAATVARLAAGANVPEHIAMMGLNIVEDVRIDRLIQRRYPGLRRDYAAGYPEMREKNLFEVAADENLNERSFLDRLNLHAKAYNGEVTFSPEEQILVDRAETTESYEEVLQLTADCLVYVKAEHDAEQNDTPENGEEVGEGEDDAEGSSNVECETEESEENSGGMAAGSEESDEDGEVGESKGEGSMESAENGEDDGSNAEGEQGDESAEGEDGESAGDPGEQDLTAEIGDGWDGQRALSAEAETKNLADMAHKSNYRGTSHTTAMAPSALGEGGVQCIAESRRLFAAFTPDSLLEGVAEDLIGKARPTAGMMAMAFERKQSAHIDNRTQIAKSGDLDMDQLHNYKLTDDLFLRNEVKPNGKNHAMTIVIDWSGSMSGKCQSTINQAVTFALFCQKVGVPCEVYIFQSGQSDSFLDGDLRQGAQLTQLIDTTCRKNVFMNDCKNALMLGVCTDGNNGYPRIEGFRLGCTPLGGSVALTKFTHNDLMKRTQAEIGSIIFLTDGDGDSGMEYGSCGAETTTLVDPISKRTYRTRTAGRRGVSPIWDWVRGETGSKIINFFMCSKREGTHLLEWRGKDDNQVKRFKAESWGEFSEEAAARDGWDAGFVVFDNAATESNDDAFNGLDGNAGRAKVRNTFIKSLQGQRAARPLVERITEMIAV